jgi:hypothetical protein
MDGNAFMPASQVSTVEYLVLTINGRNCLTSVCMRPQLYSSTQLKDNLIFQNAHPTNSHACVHCALLQSCRQLCHSYYDPYSYK